MVERHEQSRILKESSLAKLHFADNRLEIIALTQAGFAFESPPRRIDMTPRNRLIFLFNATLREEFHIDIQGLLNPLQRKVNACYEPTLDIYLDFLKNKQGHEQARTRYHELGHAYIKSRNPDIHRFLKEMNEKMFGEKYSQATVNLQNIRKRLSKNEYQKYIAFKSADEGIAQYIAVETKSVIFGTIGTELLCDAHDSAQGTIIVLDGSPISMAHSFGYHTVVHVCRQLREAGLSAKEAIDLIIENPPNDNEYFFWHDNLYAKDLLELKESRLLG